MRIDDLFEVILAGEGQTVEFKESLSSSAKREAIQTMVAFANAQGGRVFFGVRNDTTAKGIQVGNDTQERLAKLVHDHTYPLLPFVIDDPFMYGGKTVLSVEVPPDVPPVVGVYLYSSSPIPLDKPVDAQNLQAYRRVGRINQKEDFMRLRKPQPSDPKLRLELKGAGLYTDNPSAAYFSGCAWSEEGSATAHSIVFRLDPVGCDSPNTYGDLPYPMRKNSEGGSTASSRWSFYYEGFGNAVDFSFEDVTFPTLLSMVEVIATYKDDWGLTWKVSRGIHVAIYEESGRRQMELQDQGDFRRRIVCFPPKVNRGVEP